MPSLNEDNVKKTKRSFDSDSSQNLKFEENTKNSVYLLSDNYGEGYVHWVTINGQRQQIPCGGGMGGKGFAPSDCCLCQGVSEGYKEAKEITKLDELAGKALKDKMNGVRAKYTAKFLALQGDAILFKKEDGNKVLEADWDNAKVGYANLTEAQFNSLTSISDGKQYDYMKGLKDLLNRVIFTDKRKRKKDDGKLETYPTMTFTPEDHQSDRPPFEFKQDEFDVNEAFIIDPDKLKEAYNTVFNGVGSEPDDSDLEFEETTTTTSTPTSNTSVDLSDIADDFDDFEDFIDDEPSTVDPEADAKSRGFACLEDLTKCVAKVSTDTKEKVERLRNWEAISGTKKDLSVIFKLNK